MAPRKSTATADSEERASHQRLRCVGFTKRGTQCRRWAMQGEDRCHQHLAGDTEYKPKSAQAAIPSTLPGMTDQQVHDNEVAIQRTIKRHKTAAARNKIKKEQRKIQDAEKGAKKVANSVGLQLTGEVKLRTMEDCLMLIEYSVEEILDMPPSINKSKTMIQAARTAGQLIIQAGVAEQAVEWFSQNVKLVAGIDLEQI